MRKILAVALIALVSGLGAVAALAQVTSIQSDTVGRFITAGPTPTMAGCGTGTLAGNDQNGTFTAGTVTTCIVTFNRAFAAKPACYAVNETSANVLRAVSTTTTVTISGTIGMDDVVTFGCLGR